MNDSKKINELEMKLDKKSPEEKEEYNALKVKYIDNELKINTLSEPIIDELPTEWDKDKKIKTWIKIAQAPVEYKSPDPLSLIDEHVIKNGEERFDL